MNDTFSIKKAPSDQPNSGDKIDANNPKAQAGQLKSDEARPPTYKPPTGITLIDDFYNNRFGRG